jgi:hypothetical protein
MRQIALLSLVLTLTIMSDTLTMQLAIKLAKLFLLEEVRQLLLMIVKVKSLQRLTRMAKLPSLNTTLQDNSRLLLMLCKSVLNTVTIVLAI